LFAHAVRGPSKLPFVLENNPVSYSGGGKVFFPNSGFEPLTVPLLINLVAFFLKLRLVFSLSPVSVSTPHPFFAFILMFFPLFFFCFKNSFLFVSPPPTRRFRHYFPVAPVLAAGSSSSFVKACISPIWNFPFFSFFLQPLLFLIASTPFRGLTNDPNF